MPKEENTNDFKKIYKRFGGYMGWVLVVIYVLLVLLSYSLIKAAGKDS